jgi:hypothetical protein
MRSLRAVHRALRVDYSSNDDGGDEKVRDVEVVVLIEGSLRA